MNKNTFVLTKENTIAHYLMNSLRDVSMQQHRGIFRQSLKKLGYLLAYEISKSLDYEEIEIKTSLSKKQSQTLTEFPVLVPILRAGIPLYDGLLEFFDQSDSGFVGAYRGDYRSDYDFDIDLLYTACPLLKDRTVILIDPMLATGKSLIKTYQELTKKQGTPKKIHIASAIASQKGIENVSQALPTAQLWIGDVDENLNQKSYIVPGLGDAGDLAFGEKE